jgi:hypothetical protein
MLAFYRGSGLLGVEMPVSMGMPLMVVGGVNGDSRGGIKAGE